MFDRVFNAFSTFGRRREKNNSFSENFAWINEWILNEYVLNEWILILEETLAYLYRKRHSLKSRLDSDSRPYTCHWSTILCHAHITRLQKKLIQNNDLDVDFDCLYLLTRGSWMCNYVREQSKFSENKKVILQISSYYALLTRHHKYTLRLHLFPDFYNPRGNVYPVYYMEHLGIKLIFMLANMEISRSSEDCESDLSIQDWWA